MSYGQEASTSTRERDDFDCAVLDSRSDASTGSGRVSRVRDLTNPFTSASGFVAELLSTYRLLPDDITQIANDPTRVLDDPTLLPGELAIKDNRERSNTSLRLNSLLKSFSSLPNEDEYWITEEAKNAATSLIAQIPRQSPLPRLATDGEGAVILTWEIGGRSHLVIVDGQHMEIVENAATAHTNYLDPIPYSPGSHLPLRLAQLLTE